MAAHLSRVDLSAHGFYKTPKITGFGGDRPFSYFTYGAAASEVELDTLTGDFQASLALCTHCQFLARANWTHTGCEVWDFRSMLMRSQ